VEATLESFRRHDAATDVDVVTRLFDDYRGGGLAVVGIEATQSALEAGQADELLLSAGATGIDRAEDPEGAGGALPPEELTRREMLAGDLVARARRTGAEVRFIEDMNLLWEVGGMGAFLRYRPAHRDDSPPAVEVLDMDL
jgi:peptide subunit release factor 1 (eRF1)